MVKLKHLPSQNPSRLDQRNVDNPSQKLSRVHYLTNLRVSWFEHELHNRLTDLARAPIYMITAPIINLLIHVRNHLNRAQPLREARLTLPTSAVGSETRNGLSLSNLLLCGPASCWRNIHCHILVSKS